MGCRNDLDNPVPWVGQFSAHLTRYRYSILMPFRRKRDLKWATAAAKALVHGSTILSIATAGGYGTRGGKSSPTPDPIGLDLSSRWCLKVCSMRQ